MLILNITLKDEACRASFGGIMAITICSVKSEKVGIVCEWEQCVAVRYWPSIPRAAWDEEPLRYHYRGVDQKSVPAKSCQAP